MPAEQWKDIIGYEGSYQVSSYGRVKSLSRTVGHNRGGSKVLPEKLLKLNVMNTGYHRVNLRKDGRTKELLVHRLVALAFMKQTGPLVRHLNDIKTDNRIENLAWGSKLDNRNDAIKNGLIKGRLIHV